MRAVPGAGLRVPVWILGSSLFGAQLAAAMGLPYAFASHFAPAALMQAIDAYRSRFRPSARLERPYVMLGVNVFAAETDAEARLLFTLRAAGVREPAHGPAGPAAAAGRGLRGARWGRPSARSSTARCPARSWARRRRCAAAWTAFLARTGADELMVVVPDVRPCRAAAVVRAGRGGAGYFQVNGWVRIAVLGEFLSRSVKRTVYLPGGAPFRDRPRFT